MWNYQFFFMDFDGAHGGNPYVLPMEPFLSNSVGGRFFGQINSLVKIPIHQCRNLLVPGSLVLQEAVNCISKFAGAFLFWSSGVSNNSNMTQQIVSNFHGSKYRRYKLSALAKAIVSGEQNISGFHFRVLLNEASVNEMFLGKLFRTTMKLLGREAGRLKPHPIFSLAAALVPPLKNLSSDVLVVSLDNSAIQVHGCLDRKTCHVGVEQRGCTGLPYPDLNWTKRAVEPRTGIEFPILLNNIMAGNNSNLNSEILVGTGYRNMKILKIKSLKVYAFGFYVHPNSICEKLGQKYASVSAANSNLCEDFYGDLLRADVNMTVRLVVTCNGLKLKTVRSAFEKSLRARLLKTNPETDYGCVRTFGSFFTQEIPLPAGTTIDFKRTDDGKLITEIGGNQIGAVNSKDLCRAFFDMYIGDVPVSEHTKREIGRNVAAIIKRC